MVERSHETEHMTEWEESAVRAALERVLASDAFRGAPQLSSFLSYVVERKLEGRAGELKGYTIAVEALGRAADFDPQSDPIVRVEAGRLRKALSQYYGGGGLDDPIRLSMPVGCYVPMFEPNERHEGMAGRHSVVEGEGDGDCAEAAELAAPAPAASMARGPFGRWAALLGFTGFCLILPLVVWFRSELGELPAQAAPHPVEQAVLVEQATRVAGANATADLPVLAVATNESVTDPELRAIIQAFTTPLVDALARFDDLVSIKTPAGIVADGVDYVLEIHSTRVDEVIEGFGRLRSVKDGRIVWTTSVGRKIIRGIDDPQLPELARRLATRLAEPFGIIYADFRQVSRSPQMLCMFQALTLRRTMKPEDHLAARTCLQSVIEKDPSFHPAWSQFARVSLDEYTSGLNPQPGMPLDRALSAALTAVRLAPSSARAQQVMMDVRFASGAIEEALKAGHEALTSNPYDPGIMADVGARYVQLNRPAEGMPLLQRAIELSAGRPSWYDFFAFLAADLLDEQALVDSHAAFLGVDDSAFSLLGRALQHARKGEAIGLATTLKRLSAAEPLFGLDPRLYLKRKGFSPPVIDRIIQRLGQLPVEATAVR